MGTQINDIIMPTVQQPRRGATRRVLKAAGLALGAVLVSSQARGAYATVSAQSTCQNAVIDLNSAPDTENSDYCTCLEGYSDNPPDTNGGVATTPYSVSALDCKYCAPGYWLKTANVATFNALGVGAECAAMDQAKLATDVYDAGNLGMDISATFVPTELPISPMCGANYYGTPTAFDGSGCTACPGGTVSTEGTTASSGCTAPPPTTADSAGATTPIAVALATAAAVPLLL